MLERMDDLTSCSLSYVASILGGKWKPFIVWYLSMAPGKRARYSELRKSIPVRHIAQDVQPAPQRARAGGDHRARCRRGQAPARRLSAHGKGHQLRERPVLHPRLGRGVRRLFCRRRCSARRARWARACWCTAAPTTAPSRWRERITWQFDPSTFDVRAEARRATPEGNGPKRNLRIAERGNLPLQDADRLAACLGLFDCPSVSLSGKKRTYKCIIAPAIPASTEYEVGTASRSDCGARTGVRFRKDDRHDFKNQLAQTERGADC